MQKILHRLTQGNRLGLLIPLLLAIVVLFIAPNYGVGWDEPISILRGELNINYITRLEKAPLEAFGGRFHGPLLEMLINGTSQIAGWNRESPEIYLLRRIMLPLLFLGVSYVFYLIALKIFRSRLLAFASQLMLVIHPVIFAHSFYNTKDVGFLIFYIFAIYSLIYSIEKLNTRTVLIHAAVTAAAFGLRQQTFLIVAVSVFSYLLVCYWQKISLNQSVRHVFAYLLATFVFTVIITPYFWAHPIFRWGQTFLAMGAYPWNGNVLYLGQVFRAENLPWHYAFVSIWVTTPLAISSLFVGGILFQSFVIVRELLQGKLRKLNLEWLYSVITLSWALMPLAMILVLGSTLYDSWRHLFFIYPALVILAVSGLKVIMRLSKKFLRLEATNKAMLFFGGVFICTQVIFIALLHPHQSIYLNPLVLAISGDQKYFDYDYWGNSNLDALRFILAYDQRPEIRVKGANTAPLEMQLVLLEAQSRKRIIVVTGAEQADYLVTTYRRTTPSQFSTSGELVYLHKVLGMPVYGIYSLRP